MSSVDLQRTLDTIPSTSPILFFPLRLETCFDGPKKLKVRIIPDEILLRYPTDFLTKTHSEEGKRFWIQWFIASGDAKSEFQAWRNLCNKYGVHHAGQIALLTRPINLDAFRLGGDLFRSRPYAIVQSDGKVVNIYDLCDSIYEELSKIDITANSPATVSFTGVPEALNKISISLSSISTVLDLRPSIVDSFYDKIRDCVRYLTQRLEGIGAFYEKFPKYKNNKSVFDTVDKDYYAYCQLRDQVARFTTENEKKAITLEDMVNQYLNDTDFDKEFFPKTLAVNSESYGVPKASYMPNSFIFAGYAKYNDGTTGLNIVESKPFDQSVAMGADLLTSSDPGFMIDESGNMIVPDNLKWMVDYDEAEKCGLAITVNLSKECEFCHGFDTFLPCDTVYSAS
ncbi:MAG: hypothetical protein MJZ16_13150, partial [Bacteroidales bacterium]|nr:hypothetical protein [Bacteroidales bacterium]